MSIRCRTLRRSARLRPGMTVAGTLWLTLAAGTFVYAQRPQFPNRGQAPNRPQAQTQPQPQVQTIHGTLVEIAKKGRARVLVFEDETGQKRDIPLTSRIRFEVTAPGDASLIVPGQFVVAEGVLTNKQVFVRDVTLRPVRKGQKVPPGRAKKLPPRPGQSQNAVQVSGAVVAMQPDKDYPEYQRLVLKMVPQAPVMLESGFTVTVRSSDPAMAQPGASVRIEAQSVRGRLMPTRVTVALNQPVTLEMLTGEKPEDAADGDDGKSTEEAGSP